MLEGSVEEALNRAEKRGWVMEPEAKRILTNRGFDVPDSVLARTAVEAEAFAGKNGFPVAAKCVSPEILHKTEHGAVITNINSIDELNTVFHRLMKLPGAQSVLVEAMISGIELFLGMKNDYQFGPVVVLGTGGVGVEIYNDTAIRMAPVKPDDVISMVNGLKGSAVIKGFRGLPGVNLDCLIDVTVRFSQFAMELEKWVRSMDLNPVICTPDRCVIADARIMTV